jgi:hypothetical protein
LVLLQMQFWKCPGLAALILVNQFYRFLALWAHCFVRFLKGEFFSSISLLGECNAENYLIFTYLNNNIFSLRNEINSVQWVWVSCGWILVEQTSQCWLNITNSSFSPER